MLKATKDLIKIVEKRASEQNSGSEAQQLLRQGADITALTSHGPMIHCAIAEEKRYRSIIPWKADRCQQLVDVLQKGACERLAAQVLSANGGDVNEMHRLVQLKASCFQSTLYGPLGLLGALLKHETIPIRLDVIQLLIENDPETKHSLTATDDQQHTIHSLAKNNPRCPPDVIDYMQEHFDDILNQSPFVQPPIDPDDVILWIHRGANMEAVDANGNTVLANAVIANNLKLVRILTSAGSNTAHRNADGLTPLEIAKKATLRNPPMIAVLEAQHTHADLKHVIETKKTQLTAEDIRTRLENGADINGAIGNHDSFLHLLIANKGTPEMVAAFINDFNADLSATNIQGYRPIESCILLDEEPYAYLQTLFKLPKMTTDLFMNTKLNKTILQFSIENQRLEATARIQHELNLRLWDCMIRYMSTKEDYYETTLAELRKLVACGAQIDHRRCDSENRERTILHLACEIGDERLVESMINDLQAHYTLPNHDGDCPLAIAAARGYLPIVKYLCSLPNPTLNLVNKDHQTSLHLATKNRHLDVVQHLVKRGADYQAQNRLKQTPLDIAFANVSKNETEEMKDKKLIHFLEQLVSPSVDDESAQQSLDATPLPTPDLDTCELVTPVVVNPIQTNTDDTEGAIGRQRRGLFSSSPNDDLHEAARNGSVWEAQKAIVEGADVRYRKKTRTVYEVALLSAKEYHLYLQSTPLVLVNRSTFENMATGCQQIATMIQQIAQTKLLEAIDQSNASLVMSYHVAGASLTVDCLYRACQVSDSVEIVDYLLNHSTDIFRALINDSSLDSPYRTAKKKNRCKLANYLKYRLSLECTKAVKDNDLELVKKLVRAGANVDMHETNNLDEAIHHQNAELIQFLCENGAKMPSSWLTTDTIVLDPTILSQPITPELVARLNQCLINRRLRFAAASGDLDTVIRCQRLGADIDSVNCHGSTALLYTIEHGNYFPIVHALISCGASILHSNDGELLSLIDLAKTKGYKQIVDYLVKELNRQFLSAIVSNHRQTAEKLAQLGIDFNYQDEQQRTALHYAVQYHGVDLVRWLCECGSTPTLCDINGDYPIIQATEKGDYAMVELFVTKYPACKRQTNKAGWTALQVAQKLNFTRIAELIETGRAVRESSENQNGEADKPKHDHQTLIYAARDGHIRIIQDFIDQRYDSKADKRRLCYELILVANQARQRQIVDILEPYYKTKLRLELTSDMELGGGGLGFTLDEYHKKILRGFLSSLSILIANSPVVLDPTDPKTYLDLFSSLTAGIAQRSQELQQVVNEQDVKKLIEHDEKNTREQLTKISEQLEQLVVSKDALQARIEDTDERLFKQQNLTALQRREFIKEKEQHKQQLAVYECSIFLFQRQQEATLIRQKTINFIKGNPNLIMFYRTIENRLEALFHSVLAAQGGYLKREATAKLGLGSSAFHLWPTKLPILNLTAASIKAVLDPVLSKLNEKEQKKEWHNISTLGNIEELRRIASDTAGLVTLYYREQIQSIDSSQKIIPSFKHICDVRPESSEEMAVVMVAEYVTTWIIDELKLGRKRIDPSEPLSQQLWFCVAKKDLVSLSAGQQKIPMKTTNIFGEETSVSVQLRHLIGCVSVVGNDGSIYQYDAPNNELNDLEVFGYVYVTPFSVDEKAFQTIVDGRKLQLAKRDEHGNILTRFEDIIEYAQTYAIQNDQQVSQSIIAKATVNQIVEMLREQKIFVDRNDVQEQLRKVRETIELSVDVLREKIDEKTQFYQISIDAAHEQIKHESEANRQAMKANNELHYEQTSNRLNERLREIETHLEQFIENRMNVSKHDMQEQTERILTIAETANAQSLQAIAEAKQATQVSQQLLREATQAQTSVRHLAQWAEQQRRAFELETERCQAKVKQTGAAQKESYERSIVEMRTKIEQDLQRAKEAVQESAASAQQSLLNTLDIQRTMHNRLEHQRTETRKIVAEVKNAWQQAERALAEAKEAEEQAKRATDASAAILKQIEMLIKGKNEDH